MSTLPGLAGLSEVLPRPCALVLCQNDSHLLADGAEESWGEATSYSHDMPRGRGREEISVGFISPLN